MNNFQCLTSILNSEFIDNSGKLVEEKGGDINPQVVKLKPAKDTEIAVYRFDPDKIDLFPFFSRTSGLKKICDYIILANKGDKLFVLLIELKRGKESATKQLEATKSFINYCIESARRVQYPIDDGSIIRTIKISPRTTTQKTDPEYNSNGHMDYYWNTLHIRHLLK